MTTKIKWITHNNNISRYYTNKDLELTNTRVKSLNEGNKKLQKEIEIKEDQYREISKAYKKSRVCIIIL